MNRLSTFYIKKKGYPGKEEIIPYGVRMCGAPTVWRETMGEGIKVGVIDTGADIYHNDLKGRIIKYKNFTTEDMNDNNGHGTHVCGIIAASKNGIGIVGVAPECSLYVAKAFNKDGVCDEKNVIRALNWLCEENVDVINMSFSADSYTDEYYNTIRKTYNKNVVMVAAAGNEGKDTIGYPAKFSESICVGAVDIQKSTSSFSSTGERVDVTAAGTDVLSTYPGNKYAVLSGTSMATPIISGATALIQSKANKRLGRKLTFEEIRMLFKLWSRIPENTNSKNLPDCGYFSF